MNKATVNTGAKAKKSVVSAKNVGADGYFKIGDGRRTAFEKSIIGHRLLPDNVKNEWLKTLGKFVAAKKKTTTH